MLKPQKTAGVRDLVSDALRSLPQPYGEDIVEDVCIAIESDPQLRRRYNELAANLRAWVVNNWIGMYVSDLAAMKAVRQVSAKRTQLITSYRKLAR